MIQMYERQNFENGKALYAEQLNAMDEAIESHESAIAMKQDKINDLPAIRKNSQDAAELKEALKQLDDRKVGYSEVVNGQLLMYSDSTKSKLLATLDLPKEEQLIKSVSSDSFFMQGSELRLYTAEQANITNRVTRRPIAPTNLNSAVKATLTDSNKMVLTDTEKAAACQTIGAAKANNAPWKLVGTFTEANKNEELPVDLHGCSEISVVCNGEATGNVTLCMWIDGKRNNIMYYMLTATVKSSVSKLVCDGITFYQDYYRTSPTLNAEGLTAGGTDVAIICNGKTFDDVSKFSFFTGNANNINSCDIKIYAR